MLTIIYVSTVNFVKIWLYVWTIELAKGFSHTYECEVNTLFGLKDFQIGYFHKTFKPGVV